MHPERQARMQQTAAATRAAQSATVETPMLPWSVPDVPCLPAACAMSRNYAITKGDERFHSGPSAG
jgi:hypothetical protein